MNVVALLVIKMCPKLKMYLLYMVAWYQRMTWKSDIHTLYYFVMIIMYSSLAR